MADSPSETDARFRELIKQEFHTDLPAGRAPADPGPAARQAPATPPPAAPFSLDEALAAADPEPDEADRFVPPVPDPLPRPRSPRVITGLLLLGVGVVVLVLRLAGLPLPGWVGWLGALAAPAALLLALLGLPRRQTDEDDGVRL